MTPDKPVNLYQSHDQSFTGYAMAKPPLKRSTLEDATGADALARSLNKAFYITSYQSEITRYALSGTIHVALLTVITCYGPHIRCDISRNNFHTILKSLL